MFLLATCSTLLTLLFYIVHQQHAPAGAACVCGCAPLRTPPPKKNNTIFMKYFSPIPFWREEVGIPTRIFFGGLASLPLYFAIVAFSLSPRDHRLSGDSLKKWNLGKQPPERAGRDKNQGSMIQQARTHHPEKGKRRLPG